jgi:hypothetical protein
MSTRRGAAALLAGGLAPGGAAASWLVRQLALASATGLVVSAILYVILATGQLHAPYWQLWLVITGLVLVQWTGRRLREPRSAPPAAPDPALAAADSAARPYAQVDRWERRLSVTSEDPEWYARVVRDRLVTLVAERLRQRHGVRMTTEPDRARVILGDELYEFLTAPVSQPPGPAGLSRLITRTEEI